jgi:hypothetical protein
MPNTLIIGDATRRQIGGLFDLADLGPQALAGFAQPQPAWRVIGESGMLSRFEALRSGATPLVGRDEELELLIRRWEQAKSGEGRVVLISGEPGIGKSRLTAALSEASWQARMPRSAAETNARRIGEPGRKGASTELFPSIKENRGGFPASDSLEPFGVRQLDGVHELRDLVKQRSMFAAYRARFVARGGGGGVFASSKNWPTRSIAKVVPARSRRKARTRVMGMPPIASVRSNFIRWVPPFNASKEPRKRTRRDTSGAKWGTTSSFAMAAARHRLAQVRHRPARRRRHSPCRTR